MWTIYIITNTVTGLSYIGQTRHGHLRRFNDHVRSAKHSELLLGRAIRKHGAAAFKVANLQDCRSEETANAAEVRWIKKLGTLKPGGYNLHPGGGFNVAHTPEVRERMSESAKKRGMSEGARKALLQYARNQKSHSKEFIARLIESNKNRVWSVESKLKASNSKIGLSHGPLSRKQRLVISEARKGWRPSRETRSRMSVSAKHKTGAILGVKGSTMPKWVARKIGNALRGRPKVIAHRKKVSAAVKKLWESGHYNTSARWRTS